jgi:hypothetical protein
VREVAASGRLCIMRLDMQGAQVRGVGKSGLGGHVCSRGHRRLPCVPLPATLTCLRLLSPPLQALRANKRIDGLYVYVTCSQQARGARSVGVELAQAAAARATAA